MLKLAYQNTKIYVSTEPNSVDVINIFCKDNNTKQRNNQDTYHSTAASTVSLPACTASRQSSTANPMPATQANRSSMFYKNQNRDFKHNVYRPISQPNIIMKDTFSVCK